jgi:RNA polymerase sigma-70 factor (ECF subfamily)
VEQASGYAATLPGFRPACGVRRETRGGRVSDQSDDAALVEAARAGRRDAFDLLVVRHRRAVYRVCYRFAGNHEDASDLTQDAFLRAWRGLSTFKGNAAFSTWLYRIAVNACLSRPAARLSTAGPVDLEQRADETSVPQDAALGRAREAARVRAAVARLPRQQRATVILRVYQDLPHEQIARILGSSVGTVKANFFHAVRNLRRLLAETEQ